MSDQPTDATGDQNTTDAGTAPSWDDAFKGEDPTKVRKTLDHAREWEKRAKENADAAKQLTAIKDAAKSEAEKVADRLAAADSQVASVPAKVSEALRAHLVALHDINDEDAELFLTANDPQVLLKQVDRLIARGSERDAQKRKQGNFVPKEGTTSTAPENEERAFARQVFGND